MSVSWQRGLTLGRMLFRIGERLGALCIIYPLVLLLKVCSLLDRNVELCDLEFQRLSGWDNVRANGHSSGGYWR
jgi:hypothetical protein